MSRRIKRFFKLRVSPLKLKLRCESLEELKDTSSAVQIGNAESDGEQSKTIEHQEIPKVADMDRQKKISG